MKSDDNYIINRVHLIVEEAVLKINCINSCLENDNDPNRERREDEDILIQFCYLIAFDI